MTWPEASISSAERENRNGKRPCPFIRGAGRQDLPFAGGPCADRIGRCHVKYRAGRSGCSAGTQRVRKEYSFAHPRRPDSPGPGARSCERGAPRRTEFGCGHGVPEFCVTALADGPGERGTWTLRTWGVEGDLRKGSIARARHGWARGLRRSLSERIVRRYAPASRLRARVRDETGCPDDG